MLFAAAGFKRDSGDVILKVVNRSAEQIDVQIELAGRVADYSQVKSTELSAVGLNDENTFEQPRRIAPRISEVTGLNRGGRRVFRPYSITVLRWSGAFDN
jgi:alpha-L-arabinofuranosidase